MSKPKPRQEPNTPYDRFRTLFEQSMDAIYIGRPDGAIVDVNQAWLNLFGYELEDLPGLNASAFYAVPTEREDFLRRMNETGFVRDEVRYRRKDGTIFNCQRVQAAMRDSDGNVVAYQGVIRDITAHKRAEEALGVELAWRRILLEQSRDGIVVLDQDGKVVEANLRFAEMLGRSLKELLQLHVWDWDVPTPPDKLKEMVKTVDESGDHFETQHRRKDGSVYDVEISTNGAVFGGQKLILCVCRDITGRKRVQKALEQSEQRMAQLSRHSRAIAWETDLDGLFTYVSPVVEDVLGLRPGDLVGKRYFYDMMPEKPREQIKTRALSVIRAGAELNSFESPMVSADGRLLWVAISGIPVRDNDGAPLAYRGWVMDITARKAAELALGESEQRFRSLFEQSLDAIYIVAPDGRILETNQAWLDLFGYERDDLTTLKAVDVYAEPGMRDDFLKRIAETGHVKDAIRLKKKSGTVFDCERSVIALRDQSGALVAYQGVHRDVTERERARRELLESESKYRALFEHSMDAISLVSPGGLLLEANQAYLDLFGYTKEDVGIMNVEEHYVNPDDRTRLLAWIGEHGDLVDDAVRLMKRDGTVMDCLRTVVARRDADGTIIGDQSVIRDITAQKKAEEALRESEERLSQLARHSRAVAWEVDLDGLFTYVSPVMEEVLGPHPDDLVGKRHFYDLIPAEGREEIKVHALGAIRGGADITEFESPMARSDGRLLWVAVSGVPLRSSDGALVSFRGWVVDITARKTAELTVRESEERFSQLAEQSRTWAWEVDFEGLYTYVDKIAEQVIGYRPEELVGRKHFYDLHPEAQREEFKTAGLQIFQNGGELEHFENPVVGKDGRTLWFSTSGMPLRSDDGHVQGHRGWDVDITEQRRVALALSESEARFRTLFEQSWDANYVGTPDGKIIDVNQSWLDLFGYSRDELPHITVLDLYADPSDRSQFLRRIAREGHVQDEVRYKKKDGTVFDCERTVVVRTDARGHAIAYQGIFRDVSQRNRDRAELERLARFDTLTGLLNRRVILETADEWVSQTRRYRGHLSVVMLDIDHFKQVNDLHGHQAGDSVLTETAGVLQRSVRQTDFVGRYGGEEFLLVLPQTDAAGAAVIAERTRVMLQGTAMHDAGGGTYTVTASFGVAEWRDGDNVDALVSRADAAMYAAKEAGRNRVEVAPVPG